MNPPKADEPDHIRFLISARERVFACTEAARSAPENPDPPAHDAFTRLLRRGSPDTEASWQEARTLVEPESLVRQASPGGQRDQSLHPAIE